MRRLALALLAMAWAGSALAQPFPARSGESGLLDVPDAEVIGAGPGLLGAELRVDQRKTGPTDVGAFPLYAVGSLWRRMDVGLTFREWGQPGDPLPARFMIGSALKLQLAPGSQRRPAFALDVTADRINLREVIGSRLIASTAPVGAIRFSAFVGGEAGKKSGATYGGAVSFAFAREADVVLEGLGGPQGLNFGGAVRWRALKNLGMFLGFNYLPDDDGWRASLGFAFGPSRPRAVAEASPDAVAAAGAAQEAAKAPTYKTERPELKMKMRIASASTGEPRSLRHGPWTASGAAGARAGALPVAAPAVRGTAPSLEDLADAQLREQEGLAEGRERRVRSTAEQLDGRDKAAQDETRRLADRERELAAREQQLDARERRLARGGPPQQQIRDLEALEAQIAAQERTLGAQERSLGAAIDAAQGRERDAAAREDAERVEASRLAASVSGAGSRAQQLDVRKQALGARNRQLAALEARLVARGERIDTFERQLRTRSERLDGWQRRLDTRSERLDLLEQRAADPKAAAVAVPRADAKGAAQPKDKAIFVMVVKSPTAIVKERAGVASPVTPGAIQPGTAVEKAVAAATVVTFSTPAAQLSELDRETIDNIAKLASREGCELLIWARAKDPSLMAEAQRRAAEIRSRVMAVAQLADRQVVTRITTRPGAQGVDVVVSALRESAKPAAAAAAAPALAGQLQSGEAGKRQIREAVQAAQPSIEACVGDLMEQKKLPRAEGSLKLTISAAGKVVKVRAGDGDLSGAGVAECLSAASGGWAFPPADAEYVVEVPITVIRGGAQR